MEANYFFIDGSALLAQIRQLQRAEPSFRGRRICAKSLAKHLMESLPDLHGQEYKRITFYFPTGDESAVEERIVVPDFKKPGEARDIHFKYCGQKLKRSAEFDKFVEQSVPAKFHDRFAKSEKGIDIEMCCDALKLASAGRVERLFLLSNDGDFIPFCRAMKEFGSNISIIHLSEAVNPNSDLLREADSYDVISLDNLQHLFMPPLDPQTLASAEQGEESEKADPRPSDLPLIGEEGPGDEAGGIPEEGGDQEPKG